MATSLPTKIQAFRLFLLSNLLAETNVGEISGEGLRLSISRAYTTRRMYDLVLDVYDSRNDLGLNIVCDIPNSSKCWGNKTRITCQIFWGSRRSSY